MSKFKTMLAAAIAMEPRILSLLPTPKQERIYTHADEERQAKAEAKRQRKAAKRAKAARKDPPMPQDLNKREALGADSTIERRT